MLVKRLIYLGLTVVFAVLVAVGWLLWRSVPASDGQRELAGLSAPVNVAQDALGIPAISASHREDALRALGFLHARDRLFQMELMRRKGAGRLSEIFGRPALELDRRQRSYQFEPAARSIVQALPEDQKSALAAYVGGVNEYLRKPGSLPPEFLALGLKPEPWRMEDSILVALGMFQNLTGQEDDERMLSIMEKALPAELTAFLTPDTDMYSTVLAGGANSRRPVRPIPVKAWLALSGFDARHALNGIASEVPMAGSNNWAVGGIKTRDGRAMIANDMHLKLGIPNIWYRAVLSYEGRRLSGVTLPGLPLTVVGSNEHVAWGFTNIDADVLDLVLLDINPADPDEYRVPGGWRKFDRIHETIRVKGEADVPVTLVSTLWGPVSPEPLKNRPVAVHWTALQSAGVDLSLLDMDRAETLPQAMEVVNRFGGPPQNVVLADDRGHIGWTYLGRLPLRKGFDGSMARSWADGKSSWQGYIPPSDLPRVMDPPSGFLATANSRNLGRDYPHVIAHNQASGYRAYRISQRLRELEQLSEKDMLNLQLDTRSEFYDFYRQLAFSALDGKAREEPELNEAAVDIARWDGKMEADSQGIALLISFRSHLAERVFAPIVARCRSWDGGFIYRWRLMDVPLRALLSEQLAQTLPSPGYANWRQLILEALRDSVRELKEKYQVDDLGRLSWGKVNRIAIQHPFGKTSPLLSRLFDMPAIESPGCASACVRIISDSHGASERMVVSPGHSADGILHMPGGQSGNVLSANYRDQQPAWRDGTVLPFNPGKTLNSLRLVPAAPAPAPSVGVSGRGG